MTAVARLFCGSTRRITLDDEQFAQVWIALLAVGQLAREVRYIQSPLTAGQFARLSRSFAGGGGFCDFRTMPRLRPDVPRTIDQVVR